MSSNAIQQAKLHRVTDSRFPLSDFRYFNSPFEVLFNFPSRYLFAIDLSPLYSRGWRLPPILRSTPKERDSLDQGCISKNVGQEQGCHLLWRTFPGILFPHFQITMILMHNSAISGFTSRAFPTSFATTTGIPVGFFSSA
jgi:hypothetical protein